MRKNKWHFGYLLRRTPPKNYFVIFKRRVAAFIGTIVSAIHCVAIGALGLTRGENIQ